MKSGTFTVKHGVGLHARPASKFVKIAKSYEADIQLRNVTRGGETVDAKSLVKVIKIAAAQNQEVEVMVNGSDEADAFGALEAFLVDVPEDEQ